MKVIVQGREPFVVVACGFIGWALCAATMGIAMRLTALPRALVAHAVAAPLIFVVVSLFYFGAGAHGHHLALRLDSL